jgi:hypothetical protein
VKETVAQESAARGVGRTGGAKKRGAVPSLVNCCVVLCCAVWGLEKKQRSELLCVDCSGVLCGDWRRAERQAVVLSIAAGIGSS